MGNQSLGFGSSTGFGMTSGDQNSLVSIQQKIIALAANPFGDSPLFRNSIKDSNKRDEVLYKATNSSSRQAMLTCNQLSPVPARKIKPKPIPLIYKKVSRFDGLDDEDTYLENLTFVPKKSVKNLLIKPKISPLTVNATPARLSSPLETSEISPLTFVDEPPDKRIPPAEPKLQKSGSPTHLKSMPENVPVISYNANLDDTIEALHSCGTKQRGRGLGIAHESDNTSPYKEKPKDNPTHNRSREEHSPHPANIVLKQPGYYTIPPLDEIEDMIDGDGNCFVENFTVCHEKYGKVCFPGITNVAGLNLDKIVHFRPKEITVYPEDKDKPPVGVGLNRKAEVTLDCVWPTDKTTHLPIKDPERLSLIGYQEKIEKATTKLNAHFIEYRPETGSWVFQVLHFSKYGLEESDDEYEDVIKVPKVNGNKAVHLPKNQQVKKPAVNGHAPMEADPSKKFEMEKQTRAFDNDDEMEVLSLQTYVKEFSDFNNGGDYNISTHQLACSLGVDAERIQGMKASFFQEDTEDNWGMLSEMQSKDSLKILRPSQPSTPHSPAFPKRLLHHSENNASLHGELRPTSMTPPIVSALPQKNEMSSAFAIARNEILSSHPVVKPLEMLHEGIPMETSVGGCSRKLSMKQFGGSLLYGKQKKLVDMGYFMGRKFRAGWGPGWTLSFLGDNGILKSKGATKPVSVFTISTRPPTVLAREFSPLNVSTGKLQLIPDLDGDITLKKHLQESLETQMLNSNVDLEDKVPIFSPKIGIEALHCHSDLSLKHMNQMDGNHKDYEFTTQTHNVWELCVSLWGRIIGLDRNQEVSSYTQQMARREALTKWLIKTSQDRILSEINNSKDRTDYLDTLFTHLTGQQISEASRLAQSSNDHRLTLLLSQAGSNQVVKGLLTKQLINWERSKADTFLSKRRMKVYAVLAGTLVWHASNSTVNCCEDLDWKRCLALHLWYQCHPNASVQDAVAQYEVAFQGTGDHSRYAQAPYPPYIEKNGLFEEDWMTSEGIADQSEQLYDTCFHLLKLYCDRSHRLDKLLMPGTSTPAHLDHRLSWLLYQSLSALGYDHLSDVTACALHCNFASQLETLNMWHWAAFVLLHIPHPERRAKCIKELLLRHLCLNQNNESEEREAFLCEKLLIPKEWIFEAKAMKACCLGKPADEAWYLLKAGLWNKSHTIVIKHLAADSIINENYEYLLKYLKELSPPERSSTILDWSVGGQVMLDYIYISQTVDEVVKREISAYDLEKLQPEINSLSDRLTSIRCLNAKDRLCQAEMAKKTAIMLRSVYSLQEARTGNKDSVYLLAPLIQKLPMPEDYLLQELRTLARSYMKKTAAE